MALQSYGDYLTGVGFYQDPDTGSWKREDNDGVERLDAQDTGSAYYQEWAADRAAALAAAGRDPSTIVQTDPFNDQSIQFKGADGQWYFNNQNTYENQKDNPQHKALGLIAGDYGADDALGLAGNSITSQDRWAAQFQDTRGDWLSNAPVIMASIVLGGGLGGPLAGATGVSTGVAQGTIGGAVTGGFSGSEPSLSGALKGAAIGAAGGAAKGLIGPIVSDVAGGVLPDATATGTFPDSGALASTGGGQLELLSGTSIDPNTAALQQMGVDAGLSGEALQAFVDSGGGAGSTAAGGGGAASLSNLISGNEVQQNTPDSGVKSILNLINENKGLATIGTGLIGSLIQGAAAPSVAKAKAEAEAEAQKQIEAERRNATTMSGVRFNVRPTGRMLRSPGLIGRPV